MTSTLSYRGHEAPSNSDKYSPKPEKPCSIIRPVDYLIREQCLLFIFIGIAIASMFFILQPRFFASNVDENARFMHNQHHRVVYENRLSPVSQYHSGMMVNSGAKVPLGLKRKSLRVVVTGGASFVDSHLVDRLMARGDSVIVVDNFFTRRKKNVLHHFGNPRFELIRRDVVEPLLLEVDQIYHLAYPASPVQYKHNPVKTIKTNVVGTLNMLGLAKRVGACFLLTRTSEVYGDPLEHPQTKAYWGNVNPIGVRSCYDERKRTAETLTMDYHRGANVEVLIAVILGLKFGTVGDAGLTKGYSSFLVFLFCAYALGFGWSWGSLSWLIPSEIFPLEIRSAGQSINVGVNLLVTFILAQVFLWHISFLCQLGDSHDYIRLFPTPRDQKCSY